jgi:hypothetical protein
MGSVLDRKAFFKAGLSYMEGFEIETAPKAVPAEQRMIFSSLSASI